MHELIFTQIMIAEHFTHDKTTDTFHNVHNDVPSRYSGMERLINYTSYICRHLSSGLDKSSHEVIMATRQSTTAPTAFHSIIMYH